MDANRDTNASHGAAPDGSDRETGISSSPAKPPRKRRRWRRRLAIIAVLLILLVFVAPYVISTEVVTRRIVSAVSTQILGEINVGDLSLSWLGPCRIHEVSLQDPAKREVVAVKSVTLDEGLLGVISSFDDVGRVTLDSPHVALYLDDRGRISLVEALALRQPPTSQKAATVPPLTVPVTLTGGSAHIAPADGPVFDLSEINAEVNLQRLADGEATVRARLKDVGPVTAKIDVQNLTAGGQLQLSEAKGSLHLSTPEAVDLAPLTQTFLRGVQAGGKANLAINTTYEAGSLRAGIDTHLVAVQMTEPGAASAEPIDARLQGQVSYAQNVIEAALTLGGQAGDAAARLRFQPGGGAPVPTAMSIVSSILTGESVAMPTLTIDASSNLDLARLTRALPVVLAKDPDLKIASGQLHIEDLKLRGGEQPAMAATIRLAGLKGTRGEHQIDWPPLSSELDLVLEQGRGLVIRRAGFKSGFAEVVAKGTPAELRADLEGDLSKWQEQFGGMWNLGSVTLAGRLAGSLDMKRVGDDRFDLRCDLNATDARYGNGDRQIDVQSAALTAVGQLMMAKSQLDKVLIESANADLDGRVSARASGWFAPMRRGFQVDLDVSTADLTYVSTRAGHFGVVVPTDYGGTASVKASVGRDSTETPLLSEGRLVVRDLNAAGEPLTEQEVTLTWAGLEVSPDARAIKTASAQLVSAMANVAANNVRGQLAEAWNAGGEVKGSADLARCSRFIAQVTHMKEPPAISGQLTLDGKVASTEDKINLLGNCRINQLEIGTGDRYVSQDSVSLSYNASLDHQAQHIALEEMKLASELLSLHVNGNVGRYTTDCVLDLAGEYRASWQPLTALTHEFAPQTAEMITFTGTTTGKFEVKGAARQQDMRPVFRGVSSELPLGWDSAEVCSLAMGQAMLKIELRDGQFRVPMTSLPASGGRVNVSGTVDLTGGQPTLLLPGEVKILQDVQVTPELSKSLLSRINPVFAETHKIEGSMSLTTRDLSLPLGEAIKQDGKGYGQLQLDDFKMKPGGLLGKLLELGGPITDAMLAVKLTGADFEIKDGRVTYDDFTMIFPGEYDMKFSGSVGFDDTVDVVVSLPIRPELLKHFDVLIPLPEQLQAIRDARVKIPLAGSRLHPTLDLSAVDLKPILREFAPSAVLKNTGKVVETILKPLTSRPAESPDKKTNGQTEKSSTQTPGTDKKPLGEGKRKVLQNRGDDNREKDSTGNKRKR